MITKNCLSDIRAKFIQLFKAEPILIQAPGRINLIGDHTDYNDGFVMPAAIDKRVSFAIAPNSKNIFRFCAIDLDQYYETENIEPAPLEFNWTNYLLGVLAQFLKEGTELSGVDCVFQSTIPIGAGLSSSAAIECGFAFGLNNIFQTGFDSYKLAKIAQKAEHEYTGVMCGIMDQYASIFGKSGKVFRLDCRSYKHEYFPFDVNKYALILCDTNIKHELASTEYNLRRNECEKGVSILKNIMPSIEALRDVNLTIINKYKAAFDTVTFKRCLYVVKENSRVVQASTALNNLNYEAFGELMYQSHEGLQYEYEVSCRELDILVALTKNMDHVLGSRMMGGGFGGCTINLVVRSKINEFRETIVNSYNYETGSIPSIYSVTLGNGVSISDS